MSRARPQSKTPQLQQCDRHTGQPPQRTGQPPGGQASLPSGLQGTTSILGFGCLPGPRHLPQTSVHLMDGTGLRFSLVLWIGRKPVSLLVRGLLSVILRVKSELRLLGAQAGLCWVPAAQKWPELTHHFRETCVLGRSCLSLEACLPFLASF